MIFIGVNLCFWLFLHLCLLNKGNSLMKAVNASWDLLLFGVRPKGLLKADKVMPWFTILQKMWWLMIALSVFCWVLLSSTIWINIILIFLILWHLGWFILSRMSGNDDFNRVISLNSNWGIIFVEVQSDSWLSAKTLAELDLRKKNLLVLAIIRQGQIVSFPKGLESLSVGDRAVIFGDTNYFKGLTDEA